MIIGIAGPTASGKTTVAEYLASHMNAYRIKYSDVLIDIARERGIARDKASLQHLSTELRGTFGEDFLTKRLRDLLRAHATRHIVIEGNRRMVDMVFLETLSRERAEELTLMYVDADPAVRFARMNTRLMDEGRHPLTEKIFQTLEEDECEKELPLVRDYIKERGTLIDNTGLTREQFEASVKAFFSAMRSPQ